MLPLLPQPPCRRGKPKDRSRERGKKDKRRERSRERREAEERRARQQQAEEEERRRRRQQEAAEEEERRRRRQLEAAEEEERRRRRLHEAAEEEQQRRLRQRQEEEARWRRREEEEARRRQQDDEVQRRQRYQEQQRRLEAEQQRLEAEVAARARQQQQQPQAAPGDREDAERRRKRQRSPAAPSGGGPDRHWQGKQPRSEQGGRQQRDGAGAAAVSPRRQQLAGARGAAAVSPRWSRQQQRVHASHRPVPQDEAGLWQWHDRQRQGATGRYWQREWTLWFMGAAGPALPVYFCLPVCLPAGLPAGLHLPACNLPAPCLRLCFKSLPSLHRPAYPSHPCLHRTAAKARAFAGVTAHVARRLLDSVQPPRLALLSRQLLHLLRAQEAAAAFQAAAARLVEGHRVGESGDPTSLPTPEASMLASEAVDSMKQLAELLAKPLPTAAGAAQHGTPAGEPPAALLDAVVSRRLLALLAALLHVPAVHRLALEAALPASAAAVGAAQAAAVETALATQLGLGTKALLAVLASSRGGRAALLRDAAIYEALLLATDAGCLRGERPAVGAGAEGAAALQHLLLAEAATAALCGADLGSGELAAGADTAAALLADAVPSGRRAVLQALALRAAQAVPRLLLMLRLHCALLRSAAGTGAAALGKAAGGGEAAAVAAFSAAAYEPDFELQLAAAPACAHAGHLLAALLTATHADALACWQPHAAAVARAAAAEAALLAALPEAAAGVVGGLGPTRSLLAGLRGGVAAAACLHRGGLPAVMAHLARELPALEARRGPPGAPCSVAWPAVEALFWWVAAAGRGRLWLLLFELVTAVPQNVALPALPSAPHGAGLFRAPVCQQPPPCSQPERLACWRCTLSPCPLTIAAPLSLLPPMQRAGAVGLVRAGPAAVGGTPVGAGQRGPRRRCSGRRRCWAERAAAGGSDRHGTGGCIRRRRRPAGAVAAVLCCDCVMLARWWLVVAGRATVLPPHVARHAACPPTPLECPNLLPPLHRAWRGLPLT
mgnify:CR=1 FL=1